MIKLLNWVTEQFLMTCRDYSKNYIIKYKPRVEGVIQSNPLYVTSDYITIHFITTRINASGKLGHVLKL